MRPRKVSLLVREVTPEIRVAVRALPDAQELSVLDRSMEHAVLDTEPDRFTTKEEATLDGKLTQNFHVGNVPSPGDDQAVRDAAVWIDVTGSAPVHADRAVGP
jgi:hypothetical protein